MAEMIPGEPQSAADYDDRTIMAVKAVLVEIGQILGSFKGKFAIVGGAVPWLLLENEDMPHVGTIDVDLGLDAEALLEMQMNIHGVASKSFGTCYQIARSHVANCGKLWQPFKGCQLYFWPV